MEWEETLTSHGSDRVNTQGAGEIPSNPQHPPKSLSVGKHTCNPSTVEQIQISQLRRGISGPGEIVSQTVRWRIEEDTWHHSVSTRVSAHMHRYTHVHLYTTHTYTYVHTQIHIHTYKCTSTHTQLYMHTHLCGLISTTYKEFQRFNN